MSYWEETAALTFDDLYAASMMANITSVPLRSIASEHPTLCERLKECDPISLAGAFGGLLVLPELQSNCIRLEVLVHLSLALGAGSGTANELLVTELFAAVGSGPCGRAEDPAEDVFVASIGTPRGNFRVLEGIWESGGFFLQRFLDAVEKMPKGSGYDDLRESIYSLLRLSDAVCARAGLARYQLGNETPEQDLPAEIANRLEAIGSLVRFSETDLHDLA
ncbi:MAG TPA: hypothetical protein VN823_06330 [Stellaceae bacterium]|nr:hypothetical protein [Stellaceae bacterium]